MGHYHQLERYTISDVKPVDLLTKQLISIVFALSLVTRAAALNMFKSLNFVVFDIQGGQKK